MVDFAARTTERGPRVGGEPTTELAVSITLTVTPMMVRGR
jgi:hypothetical protein